MVFMSSNAHFLVLLASGRALLLDGGQRLLCEVIEDDGYIVESLLRGSRPAPLLVAGWSESSGSSGSVRRQQPARCFELVHDDASPTDPDPKRPPSAPDGSPAPVDDPVGPEEHPPVREPTPSGPPESVEALSLIDRARLRSRALLDVGR
jgi:hypothetical protein